MVPLSVVNLGWSHVYAWALLNNHAHMLVSSSEYGLSRFMRRLLTGYAVTFNRRHSRSGHLFQNRYKSIICEEDSYFLELVRYIHLNPLRAGLIQDLEALRICRWCGHGTLMGNQEYSWQNCKDVWDYFGRKKKQAIVKYEQFIADGITQGNRPELVGGGLRRSQAKEPDSQKHPEAYDERILESGDFVEQILQQVEMDDQSFASHEKQQKGEECLKRICKKFSITPQELQSGGRRQAVSSTRAVLAKELVSTFGWTSTATAKKLGVSVSAITKIISRMEVDL